MNLMDTEKNTFFLFMDSRIRGNDRKNQRSFELTGDEIALAS